MALPSDRTSTRGILTFSSLTDLAGRDDVFLAYTGKMKLRDGADGAVFEGPLGGRVKPDTIRNILIREVLKPVAVKLNRPSLLRGRLHSFRHYFCTLCASSGVTEPVVRRWMGHTSSIMLDHYFHLPGDKARESINSIKIVAHSAALAETPATENTKGDAEADRKAS
jgi:hypothetical protein